MRKLGDARRGLVDALQGVGARFCRRFPNVPLCRRINEIRALIDWLQAERRRIEQQIFNTEKQIAVLYGVISAAREGLSWLEDELREAAASASQASAMLDGLKAAKDRLRLLEWSTRSARAAR